jgi:hypothetical protein
VSDTGFGSIGNETIYFGYKTLEAVKRFQKLYASEILEPVGLTEPSGFVGFYTRSKLTSLSSTIINDSTVETTTPTLSNPPEQQNFTNINQSIVAVDNRPVIRSITPSGGKNGTRITIYGENFDTKSNTILVSNESPKSFTNISSPDGKTLSFDINVSMVKRFNEQLDSLSSDGKDKVKKQVPKYLDTTLMVGTPSGLSNQIKFKLEMY